MKFLICLLLIALTVSLVNSNQVFAEGDHSKDKRIMQFGMDWIWDDTPIFCLFEPKETVQKSFVAYYNIVEMMKYASNYWMNAMGEITGYPEGWQTEFVIYQDYEYSAAVFREHRQCNVYVHFELQDNPSNLLGGFVKVLSWDRTFDEMVIVLSNISFPDPYVNATKHETKPKEMVQDVIIHEFGHALQLGHYAPDVEISHGWHFDLMAESMMFGQVDTEYGQRLLTDRDVMSLLRMYGNDGFGGQKMPFTPYIEFPVPDDTYVVDHTMWELNKQLKLQENKEKEE